MDPIPVTGVSELVLEFPDLAAAESFYAGTLGFPVVERWTEEGMGREAVWVMAGDRTRIGLWPPQVGIAGGRPGAHVHYAMHIARGDYEPAVRRLRDAGCDVHEQDFGSDSRSAYVTDPGGHVVELWTWDVAEHLHR